MIKILIVDDKPEERFLTETILKRKGYEVISAPNGEEALKKLLAEPIDMVISDILMPVVDGFQLCREIRKDERLKDIPFVFFTATYLNDQDEELGLKLGANSYIRKPIEPDAFLKKIEEVFEGVKGGFSRPVIEEESEILKLYNERLVKKLEKKVFELTRLEEKYRTLCENINDFVFSLDEGGVFHRCKLSC